MEMINGFEIPSFMSNFRYDGWMNGSSSTPLSSLSFVVVSSIVYVTLVLLMQPGGWLSIQSTWKLNRALGFHNAILCAFSIIMTLGLVQAIFWEMSTKNSSLFGLYCDGQGKHHIGAIYFWLYVFYLSKVWEWFDTLFLVLRQRQPGFLHVYHHILTFLVMWIGLETSTTYSFVAMLSNTIIHSLMYYYYAYSSFTGRKLWWARYLTTLQMTQFALNAAGMLLWIRWDLTVDGGCSGGYVGIAFCMTAMVTYFVLFAQMFQKKY